MAETPIPPGCENVKININFMEEVLIECNAKSINKVFIMSNSSLSSKVDALEKMLVENGKQVTKNYDIKMGGLGFEGACKAAAEFRAEVVVSIGTGAIQDCAKIVRIWIAATTEDSSIEVTFEKLIEWHSANLSQKLVGQIACPSVFAMAEFTGMAGTQTADGKKAGVFAPDQIKNTMPTLILFDPTLGQDSPNWLKFGTLLRSVDHSVEAITHKKASETTTALGVKALALIQEGLKLLTEDPKSKDGMCKVFEGGWAGISAYASIYYAAGHWLENQFSARYSVHQGSCSALLMWRILHFHKQDTAEAQKLISKALGDPDASAAKLVKDLIDSCPDLPRKYEDVESVKQDDFEEFAKIQQIAMLNRLSPRQFTDFNDVLSILKTTYEEVV